MAWRAWVACWVGIGIGFVIAVASILSSILLQIGRLGGAGVVWAGVMVVCWAVMDNWKKPAKPLPRAERRRIREREQKLADEKARIRLEREIAALEREELRRNA